MHLGELSVKFACLHGKRWHTFREKGDTLSPLGKNNVRKIVCLSPYSEYCVINDIPPQTNSILCCTNSIQYVPTLYPFTLGQYCLPKPPCNQVLLFIYLSAPINFFGVIPSTSFGFVIGSSLVTGPRFVSPQDHDVMNRIQSCQIWHYNLDMRK